MGGWGGVSLLWVVVVGCKIDEISGRCRSDNADVMEMHTRQYEYDRVCVFFNRSVNTDR